MEKFIKKLSIVLLVLLAIIPCKTFSQTRLGLQFTQEELNIWRTRAKSGPYKTAGDVSVNSPGDWDRILKNANAFIANPTAERFRASTAPGCVQPNTLEPHTNGEKLKDAAFAFLITQDAKYKDAALKELLAQASDPLTDFTNRSRWCDNVLHDLNPSFAIAEWLTRLLVGYDFIRNGLSATDKAKLDLWFKNAGLYFQKNLDADLNTRFVDRWNGNYTFKYPAADAAATKTSHLNGWKIPNLALFYNNRRAAIARFYAYVGIQQNESTLKKSSKMFIKEWIKYSTFKDGVIGEFERWSDASTDQGWAYAIVSVSHAIEIADAFARTGDMELYAYTTNEGIGNTIGGPKSILLTIKNVLSYLDGSVKRYATSVATNNGNSVYLIDGVMASKNWYSTFDTWVAQANHYYKDNYIKGAYMRNGVGRKPFPSAPASAGPVQPWSGPGAAFPGKLFMYGQMEGLVNPYTTSTSNIAPTVSAGADKTILLPATSIAINGTATDADGTIASYSWTKIAGGAITMNNAATSAVTLTNLVAGTYTFRLTVKDNKGATAFDDVVVSVTGKSTPVASKTFFRGININGEALTIDGNNFESGISNSNFSYVGRTFANHVATLNPATDANRAKMIKSSIYRVEGSNEVSVSVKSVATGTYEVYVYAWEDNGSSAFNFYLENYPIGNHIIEGAGSWKKMSLGKVNVSDGNITIKAVGTDANLSGIEIYKINTTTSAEQPISMSNFENQTIAYPNPFADQLNVQLTEQEENSAMLTWSISDYSGNKLMSSEVIDPSVGLITIDNLGTLNSGTYLIKIMSTSLTRVVRVIKK